MWSDCWSDGIITFLCWMNDYILGVQVFVYCTCTLVMTWTIDTQETNVLLYSPYMHHLGLSLSFSVPSFPSIHDFSSLLFSAILRPTPSPPSDVLLAPFISLPSFFFLCLSIQKKKDRRSWDVAHSHSCSYSLPPPLLSCLVTLYSIYGCAKKNICFFC